MSVQRSDKGEKAILGIGNSVLKVKEERTARILVVGERVGETQVGAGLRVKPKSLAFFSVGDGEPSRVEHRAGWGNYSGVL